MNSQLFLITFVLYIVAMIVFGWWISRHKRGSGDDFLLGGRSVPLFLTVGTTVATMVGTGSSMGAVGSVTPTAGRVPYTGLEAPWVFYCSRSVLLPYVNFAL
ncbi:hypothetical protein [Halomonas sp. PA16-9]|uniref:hypothetical protein n=1 Tax=Halomonas sp. PA16-9 TaxID=2576841 RepID=UPI0030ED749A